MTSCTENCHAVDQQTQREVEDEVSLISAPFFIPVTYCAINVFYYAPFHKNKLTIGWIGTELVEDKVGRGGLGSEWVLAWVSGEGVQLDPLNLDFPLFGYQLFGTHYFVIKQQKYIKDSCYRHQPRPPPGCDLPNLINFLRMPMEVRVGDSERLKWEITQRSWS